MSLKDVDIRDALAPLAGDPVEDAAKVLDKLPGPGVPPIAWWLLGAGAAAGILVGVLFGPEPEPPAPQPQQPVAEQQKLPETKEEWEAELKRRFPEHYSEKFTAYGLGEIGLTEPNTKEVWFKGSIIDIAMGTVIRTTAHSQSGMLLAREVQVRMDHETTCQIVEVRKIKLDRGRIYVDTGYEGDAFVRVEVGGRQVVLEQGRAQVEVTEQEILVQVVCQQCSAIYRPEQGSTQMIRAGQALRINRADGTARREEVPFIPAVTGWMSALLLRQQDQSEVQNRIETLIEAYGETEHRDLATQELRRLTPNVVWPLIQAMETRFKDSSESFLVQTAELAAKGATFQEAGPVFRLLSMPSGKVRVVGYRNLVRITGMDPSPGEAFWRGESSAEQRDRAIQDWWQRVK